MKRLNQTVLIASFIPLCWLAMMAFHEFGHVLASWFSGGQVMKVVLHPLAISRTDVSPNPSPLLVAWAGPLIGVCLPLLIWGVMWGLALPGAYLARFFAGFCLIANGAYIGLGAFARIGDAGDLLRYGSPIVCLWLFGIITIATGFLIWQGLGPKFGLGDADGHVDVWAAHLSLGLLIALLTAMILIDSR